MIINKKGNILDSECNIICHQVNEYGVMGGGLAKQIAERYPALLESYKHVIYTNSHVNFIGKVYIWRYDDDMFIANCLTQLNNNTLYVELKNAMTEIKKYAVGEGLTIAIPKYYGCGIANGNWGIVKNILKEVFDDYDIYVYEYNPDKEV